VPGGGVSASRFSSLIRAHSASLPGAIRGRFFGCAAIARFYAPMRIVAKPGTRLELVTPSLPFAVAGGRCVRRTCSYAGVFWALDDKNFEVRITIRYVAICGDWPDFLPLEEYEWQKSGDLDPPRLGRTFGIRWRGPPPGTHEMP
jgi:hypothetical protein